MATPYALIAERLAAQHGWYNPCLRLTMQAIEALTRQLLGVMFPHFAETSCRFRLADRFTVLEQQMIELLACAPGEDRNPREDKKQAALVQHFLASLPDCAEQSREDALALLAGDPAACSLDEVILAYPGFYAVAVYRLAHHLWHAGVPVIPRMMTEAAHQKTGIDIHPGALIGRSFYIDHGTGVVIGETSVIGDQVKLYQGVTIGGLKVDKDGQAAKRHPTLEDKVTVYAGATILGGDTIVGHNSIIGGNVWLTHSVPPWSRVMFRSCDREEIIPLDARQKA